MLARIYWIYTQLKSEARPSVARFKRCFEVSRSTFRRDLDFLKDRLGAPVAYDPVGNGYYLTDSSFELPAFWFDRLHLLMMLGACRQLAAMSDSEPQEIRLFRQRIEDLLTMHYGDRVCDLVSFATVRWTRCDVGLVDALIAAMTERRMVRFTYHAAHSGETVRRVVEPYRLHHYRGSWHLAGFCRHRNAPRVFLLSRIRDFESTGRCFERNRFDAAAFLEETYGIYRGGEARKVTLRFSPGIARGIRDEVWHRDQVMTELDDGGILLSLKVADLTEIRRHALMYGPDVEVLEPPELRRQVAEAAAGILKIYGAGEKK